MMHLWMLNCSEVSKKVSRSMDETLSLSERMGIWMHLIMCRICSRYKKQLDLIHRLIHLSIVDESHENPIHSLSKESKKAMEDAIKKNLSSTG